MDQARPFSEQQAVALIGRRRDLLQLQGRADLPAGFLAVFEGTLEKTASIKEVGELDDLLGRFRVVGLGADLLLSGSDGSSGDQLLLNNLGQKLAARRVVTLAVLRDQEECSQPGLVQIFRRGETAPATIRVQPRSDRFRELEDRFAQAGFVLGFEASEQEPRLRLTLSATDRTVLTAVSDREGGFFGDLLEFAPPRDSDEPRLVSRWLPLAEREPGERTLHELLVECVRCREDESLAGLEEAWTSVVARMQPDTRNRARLELVVVAERPLEEADEARIRRFEKHGRTWVMTDRLRVGGDTQTLVLARHIWPDAVGMLLSRLSVPEKGGKPSGTFAWRGFACGAGISGAEVEKLRATYTQRILDGEGDPQPDEPPIERTGPFEPITQGPAEEIVVVPGAQWSDGYLAEVVKEKTEESRWCEDHRRAGHELGLRRLELDRKAHGADDPESAYSNEYWARVHRSPQQLRCLGTARLFRDENLDLRKKLELHLEEWRDEVLGARRRLATERVRLVQHAEEVDLARRFHLGIGWRACIGSSVAIYAGFLALYVLRVFLVFSPGAWAAGAWMFVAALAGGWIGAIAPAWVERRRGASAARAVTQGLETVVKAHAEGVRQTHEVFRDAEDIRQSIRISAIRRRTTLLANRAWTVVTRARDQVAGEFERRKLLVDSGRPGSDDERLAIEDLREWRSRVVLGPSDEGVAALPEHEQLWPAIQEVADGFRAEWQKQLEREDPRMTGFLRVFVLDRLVRDLADSVSTRLERRLLEHLETRYEDSPGDVKPSDWVGSMLRSVGLDASSHAFLSVLDEDAVQRPEGQYRVLRRKSALAKNVCDAVRDQRRGFADRESQVVEDLPFGSFAMVFHEVELAWSAGALRLDESASRAPGAGSDGGGLQ